MSVPVWVVGGSGNVGQSVVYELFSRGFPVRASSRDPERAAFLSEWAEVTYADLDEPSSLNDNFAGIEAVFLLTANAPDLAEKQIRFIEAAKAAGVRRLVKLSIVGADAASTVPVFAAHGKVERALAESGLAHVIVRAGYFLQNLIGSADQIREGGLAGLAGDGAVAFVDTRDVADVCVAALADAAHDGKVLTVTGPQAVTHAELARALGAAIGREVTYEDQDPAEVRAAMSEAGLPAWFVDDTLGLMAALREGRFAATSDLTPLIGRPGRTIEAFARDYAELFGGTAA